MTTKAHISDVVSEPVLAPQLVERVLERLGLRQRPSPDLAGLNALYAAFCGNVPFDNIQKRIWFAGPQTTPLPGGDPTEFFNNWLQHGTGGTCWPINGALYALVRACGFEARRITGSVIVEGYPRGANHGSVVVTLEGINYLVDAWMDSFKVLPLVSGKPASTGSGIHDISAAPIGDSFEIYCYPGWLREQPLPFRIESEHDPIDHAFFLARYALTKKMGFFNDALFICRHFPNSILTLGRNSKFRVSADGTLTKTQPTEGERRAALIEEFGLSEEIVEAIPPNVPNGVAPPGL
jgi:arylamine N-acetyltransferase